MNELVELRKYVGAFLRWWWLIGAITILAAGVAYYRTKQQERIYEATATVIVGQSIQLTDPDTQDIQTSDRLALTYAQIIRRQPVMQGTVDALGLEDGWRGLRSQVQVYLVPGTQLIEITVQSSSPEEARITADEVVNQLILLSPTTLENQEFEETNLFVRDRANRLQQKMETAQRKIDELEGFVLANSEKEGLEELRKEIDTLQGMLDSWEGSYSRMLVFLESEKSSNYLAVIEPAQARSTPVSPDVQLNTLLATAAGLVLALGIVFVMEYLDDRIKTEDDLRQALQVTPLGAVNRIKEKSHNDKLISLKDPFSIAAESYRMLRSNLQVIAVDRPSKTILVTSAGPQEGKSLTVANLGVVMAQAGVKTLMIDADLRRPFLHRIFNVPNSMGLTDLLRTPDAEIDAYITETRVEQLSLLASGVLPPNPSELLGSPRMGQILEEVGKIADVIILDSPPAVPVVDAIILSNHVDGVVVIADAGKTQRKALRKAMSNLERVEAKVWGAVLNRIPLPQIEYLYKQYTPYTEDENADEAEGIWKTLAPLIKLTNLPRFLGRHPQSTTPKK